MGGAEAVRWRGWRGSDASRRCSGTRWSVQAVEGSALDAEGHVPRVNALALLVVDEAVVQLALDALLAVPGRGLKVRVRLGPGKVKVGRPVRARVGVRCACGTFLRPSP